MRVRELAGHMIEPGAALWQILGKVGDPATLKGRLGSTLSRPGISIVVSSSVFIAQAQFMPITPYHRTVGRDMTVPGAETQFAATQASSSVVQCAGRAHPPGSCVSLLPYAELTWA